MIVNNVHHIAFCVFIRVEFDKYVLIKGLFYSLFH